MIEIISQVNKTGSSTLGDKCLVKNSIIARKVASSVPQGDEMLYDQEDPKEWMLDTATGASFSKDLFTLIDQAAVAEIKFIHIQCYKMVLDSDDINAPIRFAVNLGGVALGKMSQFQMVNIDALTSASLTISDITIAANEKAILKATFALKK